jgi:hypothetical protein
MPDNKRTFEAQTLKVKPIQPRAKVKADSGLAVPNKDHMGTKHFSFSKDVILRLIEWLEKE